MNLQRGTPFFLLLLGFSAGSAAAEPALSFEVTSIRASGVTPGGKVVWFSVARETPDHATTIVGRDGIVSDDDRDGTVRFDLEQAVPFQSIWVAVDLTSGATAVAAPEGYPLKRFELPVQALRGGEGKSDWIEDTRGMLYVLLSKPGIGAWSGRVGDGGFDDGDDTYDGRLAAPLARLAGVGPNPAEAPSRFGARDVVVVIDPDRMEIGLRQLTATEVPQ